MTDSRLQGLKRAWEASGSPEDGAALLHERLRVGVVSEEQIRVAAYCGHAGARSLRPTSAGDLVERLTQQTAVRLLIAISRVGAGGSYALLVHAAESWLACPCERHRDVVRQLVPLGGSSPDEIKELEWPNLPEVTARAVVVDLATAQALVSRALAIGGERHTREDEFLEQLSGEVLPWALGGVDPLAAQHLTPSRVYQPPFLEALVASAELVDPREAGRAGALLAWRLLHSSGQLGALDHARRSIEALTRAEEQESAHYGLALLTRVRAELEKAWEVGPPEADHVDPRLEQAARLLASSNDLGFLLCAGSARQDLAHTLRRQERGPEAKAQLLEAIELYRKGGSHSEDISVLLELSAWALEDGDYEEAREAVEAAGRLACRLFGSERAKRLRAKCRDQRAAVFREQGLPVPPHAVRWEACSDTAEGT